MLNLAIHYNVSDFDFWAHLVEAFRVDHVYVLGLPEDMETDRWTSVGSFDELPTGAVRVVLQPCNGKYFQGETLLSEFTHPENAIYIFGSDDCHNLPVACDSSVYVRPPHSCTTFYASQVGFLVLYDRGQRGSS